MQVVYWKTVALISCVFSLLHWLKIRLINGEYSVEKSVKTYCQMFITCEQRLHNVVDKCIGNIYQFDCLTQALS